METIYAIVHKTKKLAYIGRTSRTLEERWYEHQRDASLNEKGHAIYEAMRHEPGEFEIILCEQSVSATEAYWLDVFKTDGYELLNDASPNRKPPKTRDKEKERLWREVNKQAFFLTKDT